MAADTHNCIIWDVEADKSESQCYSQLYCKAEDSLGYMILSQQDTELSWHMLSQRDFLFTAYSPL